MPTPHPDRGRNPNTHPVRHSTWYRAIQEMQTEVFVLCKQKGWYDRPVDFPTAVALMHSEVSEALLAWRDHGMQDVTGQVRLAGTSNTLKPKLEPDDELILKPEGVGSEFADILIRLLDDAERFGVDLVFEFERKMAYNVTRPYRHGRTNPEGI